MAKRWTPERLREEALKYETRTRFARQSSGAHRAAVALDILNKICYHMPKHADRSGENNPRFYWTKEKLIIEALKYTTRAEFQRKSKGAYLSAFRGGLLEKICTHMNNVYQTWNSRSLQVEALKYNTRSQFQNNNAAAYMSALRMNILDKICSHMDEIFKIWDSDSIQKEASKYGSRAEFRNGSSAYQAACKRKILNAVCSHMKRPGDVSSAEKNLLDIVKEKHPKAQKLRDRKVKIKDRPHITGFDIDIYIPELRKGIEFDGTYWHSVRGLKRSRIDWPEEDLQDYNKIKDEHFLSKGISILHIREEDWAKDKEGCVKKCFEFLGIPNEF